MKVKFDGVEVFVPRIIDLVAQSPCDVVEGITVNIVGPGNIVFKPNAGPLDASILVTSINGGVLSLASIKGPPDNGSPHVTRFVFERNYETAIKAAAAALPVLEQGKKLVGGVKELDDAIALCKSAILNHNRIAAGG